MADPLIDDTTGTTETYLPHHLKSRTGRITLGPRRNGPSTVIVKHLLAWEAEQYEDVPDHEIHLNHRQHGFNPWYPFQCGADFQLAYWFIRNRISDTAITSYFNSGQ